MPFRPDPARRRAGGTEAPGEREQPLEEQLPASLLGVLNSTEMGVPGKGRHEGYGAAGFCESEQTAPAAISSRENEQSPPSLLLLQPLHLGSSPCKSY